MQGQEMLSTSMIMLLRKGTKSLFINADRFATGQMDLKSSLETMVEIPVYRLDKDRKPIISDGGKGAGFRMDGLNVEPKGFTGTNDWTQVSYEFETGNNDCAIIACVLDIEKTAKGRAWFDNMNMELISSEKIVTDIKINTANKS